ncbi:hypothetical protein JD844_016163 [Phrynosoma platyrhinos]|uniref:Cytochrome oxidase subunit 1 n=1 Tax=Phrynosoma platyrhinos TaxID=52577 RepID=A0ABQ7SK03_PHRPL|nr:hypothetical protein JD844_016163 [Phrynosoma platyrhinos]
MAWLYTNKNISAFSMYFYLLLSKYDFVDSLYCSYPLCHSSLKT